MSSRVAGAGLALIAAALFAVSIATPVVLPAQLSLFAGHPTVNGKTREMQDYYVGFYGARLCNPGGDGTCMTGDPQRTFKLTAFAELGVTGLLGASLLVLALLTLRKSERRKAAGRFVRILAVLAAAGAGALIVLGPTEQAEIPLGIGMAMYGGAVLGAFLASVLAGRSPPPLKLRVAGRGSQPVAAIPAPQPFDMQALFGDDQRRPAERGPEPARWPGPQVRPEQPPGSGDFEESANPFAIPQPGGEGPLFSSSPQLRPLYDATPLQGGTGGLIPIERPVMPSEPPAPMPRAQISAVAGIPTPPAFTAERPKTLPPPNFGARTKPSSIAPPLPPGASPRTQVSLVPPMPDNDIAIAPPPPAPVPPPPPPPPVVSDGKPEVSEAPPNTEPNLFPSIETPLAPPPMPSTTTPRPRAETPLAPPPPPVAPLPRPQRESQPLPRPQRDTQSPRPGGRAAVPMPARPAASPTRPPPFSVPSPARGAPPRPIVVPTSIPPIPAIPAIPMLANRAAADLHDRAATVDQTVDQPTGARFPVEIGDSTSQTSVSFGMVTAEELAAAVDDFVVPHDATGELHAGEVHTDAIELGGHDRATAAELGFAEPTTAGEPLEPLDDLDAAVGKTDPSRATAPPAAPYPAFASPASLTPLVPVFPVAVAPLPVTPVSRDRAIPKLPISTAPDSLPPPKDTKQQSGPSPACPQCESPMAWVEEHLRFYCKSCRMYF